MEIERKFLLDRLPPDLGDGLAIEQGYLAIGDDGVEVRVRRHGGERTLTVKSGPAHVRTEEEFDVDERRFDALWPLTEGRRIVKTRHRVDLGGGLTAEVDVYGGANEGLAVAEVEFPDEEASDRFSAPSWLGREVTGDARYANQRLALSGPPARA
jgi:CYTH domain-containing protein